MSRSFSQEHGKGATVSVLDPPTRKGHGGRGSSAWGSLNGVAPTHVEGGTLEAATIEALLAEADSALGVIDEDKTGSALFRVPAAGGSDDAQWGKSKDSVSQHLTEAKKAIAASQVQIFGILSECVEAVRRSTEAEAQAVKGENQRLLAELSRLGDGACAPEPHSTGSSDGWRPHSEERLQQPPEQTMPEEQDPSDLAVLPGSIVVEDMPGVASHASRLSPTDFCTASQGTSSRGTGARQRRKATSPHPGSERSRSLHRQNERRSSLFSLGSAAMFADADKMKAQIRQSMAKPVYNVVNHYKDRGVWQKVARSNWFEQLTLCVIFLNAIWIGIDTDFNNSHFLMGAHPIFVVMENAFCLFFTVEWLVRFMAFREKTLALRDHWFMFDTLLVAITIAETWVITLVTGVMFVASGGQGSVESLFDTDASTLRLLRLLRITRMARMARIFRAMPELMIFMKGLVAAIRSVGVTLAMLTLIIYIFGLAFASLAVGTSLGSRYFSSVSHSMNTLLLHGVFLEDIPEVFNACGEESFVYFGVLLLFVLMASFLVVNMLIGVMVETVHVVSMVEREQLSVTFTKDKLLNMLQTTNLDANGDNKISKAELGALLQIPEAVRALQELGVDAVALVDLAGYVFQESAELCFPAFMDMVLQLRGNNKATVKDIVDLRKCMRQEIHKLNKLVLLALHPTAQAGIAGTASTACEQMPCGPCPPCVAPPPQQLDSRQIATLRSKDWGSVDIDL